MTANKARTMPIGKQHVTKGWTRGDVKTLLCLCPDCIRQRPERRKFLLKRRGEDTVRYGGHRYDKVTGRKVA